MGELEAAAGVDRRQLARDYGNKRGLFLQALDDYHDAASARILRPMEEEGAGLEGIEAALSTLNSILGQTGCLMSNTSTDPIVQQDREVQARVRAFYDRIEAAYFHALTNASEQGEIALRTQELREAARHLLTTHIGLTALARNGSPLEVREDAVRSALASLHREESC